jgi:hypothetical protein
MIITIQIIEEKKNRLFFFLQITGNLIIVCTAIGNIN